MEHKYGDKNSDDLIVDCWLCGKELVVLETKKGKPYLFCDDCKMRIFINSKYGIMKLREKVRRKE